MGALHINSNSSTHSCGDNKMQSKGFRVWLLSYEIKQNFLFKNYNKKSQDKLCL